MRDSTIKTEPASVKRGGFSFSGAGNSQVRTVSLPSTGPLFNKKEYTKKWKRNHPEAQKIYNKRWKYKNLEKLRICKKSWRDKNKEYIKNYQKENGKKIYKYQNKIGSCRARKIVARAIKLEKLLSLSKNIIQCTDCPNQAIVYDHRDYNFPLKVEPVCISCNLKRGKAIPLLRTSP